MSGTGNETLDRIQQEIKESLEREEELRRKYNKLNNNVEPGPTINNNKVEAEPIANNNIPKSPSPVPILTNGTSKGAPSRPPNGTRLFAPHPSRGVMQKFIKMRGKLNGVTTLKSSTPKPAFWAPKDPVEPPRVTLEPGKDLRNGFVPAEEKMRRELLEFQTREAELRKERRQSQPDLMAALEAEQNHETNLKPASALYSSGDLTDDSAPASLKPARSLADLLCDDEIDGPATPGTYSLIKQFESLGSQSRLA